MKKKFINLWLRSKMRHKQFKSETSKLVYYPVVGLAAALVAGFTIFLMVLLVFGPQLPDISDSQNLIPAQSSVILDREGNVLYTIYGEENRKPVKLENISKYIVDAALAIEDDRFYQHNGIDVGAILKAVCSEVKLCPKPRGGSTITQQFVKNAFLSPERTYSRKIKEILLSLQLERKFTKDQILEMYLNRISYGSNIFGVERASNTFFGKPAKDLTVAEAAILASIPKAPTYYFPYNERVYVTVDLSDDVVFDNDIFTEQDVVDLGLDVINKGLLGKTYIFGQELDEDGNITKEGRPIYFKGRVDFVLGRMLSLGYITQQEHDDALIEATNKQFKEYREEILAPHFVMYVREQVEQLFGKEQVEKGGLKITTTLNPDFQAAAEAAIERYGESNEGRYGASNESLVAMDPVTGEILAMVGSRDYWNDEIDGKVNISLRSRLPGSSFKPIAYAAAFLQGYAPSTVVYDAKTKFGAWYEPVNFDGEFRGPVSFRQALAHSINVPAVKAAYLAGVPNVLNLGRKLGIKLNQPDDWYGLSLALGAGEARLIDMVGAYSVFANGGYRTEPVSILKVEDKNGNILQEFEGPKKRTMILDPQVAYLINNVLSDREARPAGFWRDRLSIPGQINAAKTGTSNKRKGEDSVFPFDAWTLGYTKRLVAGVWGGNANGDQLKPKASGLDVAGGIWHDFMVEATKDYPKEAFDRPEGIRFVQVSKRSGKLPSEYTRDEDIITGIFASFSVPRDIDDSYQLVEIDKVSGKLATEFTPPEALEEKAFYSHHSILPDNKNWEDAVKAWAEENDQNEEVPTEYDDVHTPENMNLKPSIVIRTPSNLSTVTPPVVGVSVDVSSKAGVSKVDYYWDDKLADTSEVPPFKGSIKIFASKNKRGSKHTLRAVVYDALYRSSQSTIEVKIGNDSSAPSVAFTYPGNGKSLEAGSSIAVQVDASDRGGDISKIEFRLDGKLVDTVKNPPYIYQLLVPNKIGSHELEAKAYDYAKNSKSTVLNFESVAPSSAGSPSNTSIVEPRKNQSFKEGERILIQIALNKEAQNDLKELILTRKKKGERAETMLSMDGAPGAAAKHVFIWASPLAGTYELQVKTVLTDGTIRFSSKVPIVVR